MSEVNKQPAARLYLHPISVKIWRNESKESNVYFSASFERRYKDKDGKWASTQSVPADEILLLGKAADCAFDEILRLKLAERPVPEIADPAVA